MATPAPASTPGTASPTSHSSSHRHRTSTLTMSSSTPSATPYDTNSEQHADAQHTNRIVIGIFSSIGAILLCLLAFQLYRRFRGRRKARAVPLPPPLSTKPMSQLGYRHSRVASMYHDHPTPDFSRPPSALVHKEQSFGSGSAFATTPSVDSYAASTELLGAEDVTKRSTEVPLRSGHFVQESFSDNSLGSQAITPNDEETGRRLSPLGSRSQSPTNTSPPRPLSQARLHVRPESRGRHSRPYSALSTSRQSFLNTGSWQHDLNRHSSIPASNRTSYYGSGNYGAPHSPQVRDRLGLVMPQPLAPELYNHATDGHLGMAAGSMNGARESQNSLAQAGVDQRSVSLRRARADSWISQEHKASPGESPSASAVRLSPAKDGASSRGRTTVPRS